MSARAPTQRQLRVGEEMRHAVVEILAHAHFHDPDLAEVPVTVTEVKVSPDLRNASVFVTPLGGEDTARVVKALNRASGYVRRELARGLTLRFVPRVKFEADTSFEYSTRIENLLRQPEVARDLAPRDGDDDGMDESVSGKSPEAEGNSGEGRDGS